MSDDCIFDIDIKTEYEKMRNSLHHFIASKANRFAINTVAGYEMIENKDADDYEDLKFNQPVKVDKLREFVEDYYCQVAERMFNVVILLELVKLLKKSFDEGRLMSFSEALSRRLLDIYKIVDEIKERNT